LPTLAPNGDGGAAALHLERLDEMTCRLRFDRARVSSSDLIRQILAAVEVRDFVIEDEPIEEIIKRIYSGEAELSLCQPEEKNGSR
jgi:ABC-type uncharacterized transport system ATPase subunit